jgi:hypothetical protein
MALEHELREFESRRSELEAKHLGKWIVIHDSELAGVFDDFETAATDAVVKFGRGPYLIRQVGAPPVVLPVSVMQSWRDAAN